MAGIELELIADPLGGSKVKGKPPFCVTPEAPGKFGVEGRA